MQRKIRLGRQGYLVLKTKGLEFVEKWFVTSKPVPPDLTKSYQLLLHMVTMKGTLPVYLAIKLGCPGKIINEAASRGHIELSRVPKRPSNEILERIKGIIGKPPREMSV